MYGYCLYDVVERACIVSLPAFLAEVVDVAPVGQHKRPAGGQRQGKERLQGHPIVVEPAHVWLERDVPGRIFFVAFCVRASPYWRLLGPCSPIYRVGRFAVIIDSIVMFAHKVAIGVSSLLPSTWRCFGSRLVFPWRFERRVDRESRSVVTFLLHFIIQFPS